MPETPFLSVWSTVREPFHRKVIMNRRNFIAAGVAASLSATDLARGLAQTSSGDATATISLGAAGSGKDIPADFTGLSYESAQLANPGYFSAKDSDLVGLVRQLGSQGVLRIGGNTSDFDDWTPGHVAPSAASEQPVGPDAGLNIGRHTVVSETAIDELKGFLKATDWGLIYGIDLGHGDPDRAADEAAYVVKTIGSPLIALQIGNEPDLFYRNGIRKPDYGFADYLEEWNRFATAIRKRVPSAPLAGPDIGNHYDWVDQFASSTKNIKMLTSHYYAEGPPTSPAADIPHLLRSHPTFEDRLRHLVAVGKSIDAPYRLCEGNSCYHGGKAGVSDAFASALWGADFMMMLASLGVEGVNFHGGGQGHYTPIAGGGSRPFEARPLFYGMLFFREFAAKASMMSSNLNAGAVNATAYASTQDSKLKLAVINKDEALPLKLRLTDRRFARPVRQLALTAPALESLSGTTLGGATVASNGRWTPAYTHGAPSIQNSTLTVPNGSALLLEFA